MCIRDSGNVGQKDELDDLEARAKACLLYTSSAMMVWLPMFGQTYLDMGVNAGALRRLLLCTTQTFDSLPHAQSIANTLGVFGLTHKQAYKELFITTVIFPTIFSIFCCICCMIFYAV